MDVNKLEGKARVDQLLLEPLAGLKRGRDKDGRRLSAEGQDKMVARLQSWLTYMGDDQLMALRDHIVVLAVKGEWPSEFHIRQVAMKLQDPPPEVSYYPRSMMTSALGVRAVAEGWAFEMYQEVKRYGPPPFLEGGWKEKQLREEAEKNQHRIEVIQERIARGDVTDRELEWLAYYNRDMAEIVAMQDEKRNGAAA